MTLYHSIRRVFNVPGVPVGCLAADTEILGDVLYRHGCVHEEVAQDREVGRVESLPGGLSPGLGAVARGELRPIEFPPALLEIEEVHTHGLVSPPGESEGRVHLGDEARLLHSLQESGELFIVLLGQVEVKNVLAVGERPVDTVKEPMTAHVAAQLDSVLSVFLRYVDHGCDLPQTQGSPAGTGLDHVPFLLDG